MALHIADNYEREVLLEINTFSDLSGELTIRESLKGRNVVQRCQESQVVKVSKRVNF